MGEFIDLTGKKFGKLTVVMRAPDHISPTGKHITMWYCNCDCGTQMKAIRRSNLIGGLTTTCGCRINNSYDLSGEYGIGKDINGKEFYFDLEDYDKIKMYPWSFTTNGYVTNNITYLHRLILDVDDKNTDVDHINHNKYDCRKSNLRKCTRKQNSYNTKIKKNNKSGKTGVYFDEKHNKWIAQINIDGGCIHLGRFNQYEDAVKARKEAEQKYFGEYAYGFL